MSDKSSNKEFELVFEGIEDSSASMQRIKGVLIGDMELSIPEVQRILENSPLTIKRSYAESDLLVYYNNLKAAGAKVLIVRPELAVAAEEGNLESSPNEIEFKLEQAFNSEPIEKAASSPTLEKNNPEEGEEIEFEFEFDSSHQELPKKEKARPYAIDLDLDSPVNLEELEKELVDSLDQNRELTPEIAALDDNIVATLDVAENILTEDLSAALQDVSSATTIAQAPPPQSLDDFALEIAPVAQTMELIDTTQIVNDIDENGDWGVNALSSSLADSPSTTGAPIAIEEKIDLGGPLFEIENANAQTAAEQNKVTAAIEIGTINKEPNEPPLKTSEIKEEPVKQPLQPQSAASTIFEIENAQSPTNEPTSILAKDEQATETKSNIEANSLELTTETASKANSAVAEAPQIAPSTSSTETAPKEIPAVKTNVAQLTKLKSKKNKLPSEIVIPVVIGGILLGIANWYYFSSKAESTAADEAISASIIQAEQNLDMSQESTAAVIKLESHGFLGDNSTDGLESKASLSSDGQSISQFKFEATTPRPAELTPEEIVQQIEPRPWLYKVEIENMQFKQLDDGSFKGEGPSRMYVEQGADRSRLIADASVEIKIIDDQSISLSVKVSMNHPDTADDARAFYIEKTSDGVFHSIFSAQFVLQKLAAISK